MVSIVGLFAVFALAALIVLRKKGLENLRSASRPARICAKCGSYYSFYEESCGHCRELSNDELISIQIENSRNERVMKRIGLAILTLSIVAAVAWGVFGLTT